jgi:hypothetical protein
LRRRLRHCATEITGKKMPCAANMAEFLRFQPMAVSKPLKSHAPICRSQKSRIWIGGSLTHLTHITHRIFGVSYASCSWSPMRWPAPDHDHESARAAYLRGPLPGSCLACRFRNCGWSLRSRRSAAPDRPVQDGSAGAHQRGCHMLIRHDCQGLSYQAHPDLDQNLLYCLIWIR